MDNYIKEMVELLCQDKIIRASDEAFAIEALEQYWSNKVVTVWRIEDIALAIGQIGLTDEQAIAIQKRLLEQYDPDEGITRATVRKVALELGRKGILSINPYGPPRPAPRYFVVHVQEVCGERENSYTVKVIYVGTDTAENIALGVGINTNSDLDPDPFDREDFWFESSSIRVKVGKMTAEEITLEKFQQNEYLSEMVVDDDDVRRAIAYKSGASSKEWWKEDED